MLPIERLQKIQVILEEREVVSIPELEKLLDASKATVYRDIKTLQKEGKLQFVRGGISKAPYDRRVELPYHVKRSSNVEEKKRIAREAAENIHPNSTIWMDSSTTVYEMAKYLRPDMNLKVLTNDLMIGAELAVLPGVEAHVIGGMILKQQVMAASAECLLLADHTKFNTTAFMSFCRAEDIDQIITGKELADSLYDEYLAADINLLRV